MSDESAEVAESDLVQEGEEIVAGDLDVVFVNGPCHLDSASDGGELFDVPPTWDPGRDETGVYRRTRISMQVFGKEHLVYVWTGKTL